MKEDDSSFIPHPSSLAGADGGLPDGWRIWPATRCSGSSRRQQLDDWLAAGQEIDLRRRRDDLSGEHPGAWVYLVRDGRVRILRRSGPREITLGTLLPGDVFGEYALLPSGPQYRDLPHCRPCAAAVPAAGTAADCPPGPDSRSGRT